MHLQSLCSNVQEGETLLWKSLYTVNIVWLMGYFDLVVHWWTSASGFVACVVLVALISAANKTLLNISGVVGIVFTDWPSNVGAFNSLHIKWKFKARAFPVGVVAFLSLPQVMVWHARKDVSKTNTFSKNKSFEIGRLHQKTSQDTFCFGFAISFLKVNKGILTGILRSKSPQ